MQTKVFFSWSGDLSERLAAIFRDWLPSVLQTCQPFFSTQDIDKGNRWNPTLDAELGTSHAGIIFVTPQNSKAPWLLFEAGALSHAVTRAKVCPLLFNFSSAMDLSGPLASFQATTYGYGEVLGLVKSLASLSPLSQPAPVIEKTFGSMWTDLDRAIQEALSAPSEDREEAPKRDEKEVLGDIVRWCETLQLQNEQLLSFASSTALEVAKLRSARTLLPTWGPSAPTGWVEIGGNPGPGISGELIDLPPPTTTPPPSWQGFQGPTGPRVSSGPTGPADGDGLLKPRVAPSWLKQGKQKGD